MAFVGILKIAPFVIWGTNLIVIGWSVYKDKPNRREILKKAPLVLGFGLVPLVYIILSAPFVPLVHMKLPVFARTSREALSRFVDRLPPTTQVGLTTITWYGRPRTTWMRVSELRPTKSLFGIENVLWDSPPKHLQKRTSLDEGIRTKFFIGRPGSKTFESSIWEKVFTTIRSRGVK